jgi:hypothetical protein
VPNQQQVIRLYLFFHNLFNPSNRKIWVIHVVMETTKCRSVIYKTNHKGWFSYEFTQGCRVISERDQLWVTGDATYYV